MKNQVRNSLVIGIVALLFMFSCSNSTHDKTKLTDNPEAEMQFKKWVVSKPVFEKGAKGTFDEISVKDPSIVFFNSKYHIGKVHTFAYC